MERMQEIGSTVTGFKRTLADWAKKKGLEGNQNFIKKYTCTCTYVLIMCNSYTVFCKCT